MILGMCYISYILCNFVRNQILQVVFISQFKDQGFSTKIKVYTPRVYTLPAASAVVISAFLDSKKKKEKKT